MEWLGSAEIDAIDSCSPEGGFMGQLWSGHRTAIDLLVSVERRSPSFAPQVGQVPSGGSEFGFQNLLQSSHQGTGSRRLPGQTGGTP